MFSSIQVRNVQEAYVRGLALVRGEGILEETRNGPAVVVPWPVVTVYERPCERVLLDPVRDANPFFHLQEGLWMLAGRNDVESIGRFLGGLKKYSDDGVTYHGAYGHRWRQHFQSGWAELDQLAEIVRLLRANPADRRIVLQMWDATTDLGKDGRDFPCNTQCMFRVQPSLFARGRSALSMTVHNRSNDAIWGAYGANAVHFSILHEFVASALGLEVGPMYQWSNNLHAYTETLEKVGEPRLYTTRDMGYVDADEGEGPAVGLTMYQARDFRAEPLFHRSPEMPIDSILEEIEAYWDETMSRPPRFFTVRGLRTLELARDSYAAYKSKEYDVALRIAGDIPHRDWQRGCVEWLERRAASREARAVHPGD